MARSSVVVKPGRDIGDERQFQTERDPVTLKDERGGATAPREALEAKLKEAESRIRELTASNRRQNRDESGKKLSTATTPIEKAYGGEKEDVGGAVTSTVTEAQFLRFATPLSPPCPHHRDIYGYTWSSRDGRAIRGECGLPPVKTEDIPDFDWRWVGGYKGPRECPLGLTAPLSLLPPSL